MATKVILLLMTSDWIRILVHQVCKQAIMQSDEDLPCPLTESFDTIECISGEQCLDGTLYMRSINLICAFCT